MSKLEIEFEITGLKFKISGEKDTVPAALASLQKQVASLAQSVAMTAATLDGNAPRVTQIDSVEQAPPTLDLAKALAAPPVRKSRKGQGGGRKEGEAIEFRHDAEKFGFPSQSWNTATKAMWLLYVVEQQTGQTEVSAPALAATFNTYFRQSGDIRRGNISRDLGAAKGKNRYVNSDPTKEPETWFLLTAGKTAMQNLIQNPNAAETTETE